MLFNIISWERITNSIAFGNTKNLHRNVVCLFIMFIKRNNPLRLCRKWQWREYTFYSLISYYRETWITMRMNQRNSFRARYLFVLRFIYKIKMLKWKTLFFLNFLCVYISTNTEWCPYWTSTQASPTKWWHRHYSQSIMASHLLSHSLIYQHYHSQSNKTQHLFTSFDFEICRSHSNCWSSPNVYSKEKIYIYITKESTLVTVKLEPCLYSRFSFIKSNISTEIFPIHIINIVVLGS